MLSLILASVELSDLLLLLDRFLLLMEILLLLLLLLVRFLSDWWRNPTPKHEPNDEDIDAHTLPFPSDAVLRSEHAPRPHIMRTRTSVRRRRSRCRRGGAGAVGSRGRPTLVGDDDGFSELGPSSSSPRSNCCCRRLTHSDRLDSCSVNSSSLRRSVSPMVYLPSSRER